MRPRHLLALVGALVAASLHFVGTAAEADTKARPVSPLYGVAIPDGYRAWQFVAPAAEAEPLNELRVVVGNEIATEAYRTGTLPFPDGAVLVKLAWQQHRSPDFESATVPGRATTVQVMVKDSKKYPRSGGWGFGRFIDGKPVDEDQHRTCFACHEARVKAHDYVFTRFAR
jgi:hypothetical protein